MSTRQDDTQDRASIAVREFRKMIPSLTAYAQAITGNSRLRVQMGAMDMTTSKVITLRPPLALADPQVHDRWLCEEREGPRLLCPACRRMEEIYAAVYHEIGHHLGGSMADMDYLAMHGRVWDAAVTHGSPELAEWTRDRLEWMRQIDDDRQGIYEFSGRFSGFLVNFIRALDDVRVDALSAAARPGVEEMRWNQTEIILDQGVQGETEDQFDTWGSRPIEVQIPFAVMIARQGHDLDGRVDPRVLQLLELPTFAALLNEPLNDNLDVIGNAMAWLAECHKLGLYALPVPPPPVPAPPADPQEDSESADGSGGGGEEKGEPSEDDGTSDSGNGSGSGDGNSDSADPDSGDDGSEPDDAGDNAEGGQSGAGNSAGNPAGGQSDASGSDDAGEDDDDTDGESGGEEDSTEETEDEVGGENSEDEDSPGEPENQEPGGEPGSNQDDHVQPSGADADRSTDDSAGEAPERDAGADESKDGADGDLDGDSREADADTSDEGSENPEDATGGAVAEIVDIVEGTPDFSDVEHQSAHEIDQALKQATGHEQGEALILGTHDGDIAPVDWSTMDQAVHKALVFDDASTVIRGQRVYTKAREKRSCRDPFWDANKAAKFVPLDTKTLAPPTLHARRVFSDSKQDKFVRGLKKGKIASGTLHKAWNRDEERFFQRRIRAQGIDDEVIIGMDVSGSTKYGWLPTIKKAAHGMADVLHAVGVKFSVYAHSTDDHWADNDFLQEIYQVKGVDQPWGPVQKEFLAGLDAMDGSLDGHNFEFYRKQLMRSTAKRKTLVYYTDGQIPETNSIEERAIILKEMQLYKRLGIGILVVAFGTDGPKNFGMDTIKVESADDIITVIKELEKRLTH